MNNQAMTALVRRAYRDLRKSDSFNHRNPASDLLCNRGTMLAEYAINPREDRAADEFRYIGYRKQSAFINEALGIVSASDIRVPSKASLKTLHRCPVYRGEIRLAAR
jgi:hypothetical protein